MGVKSLLGSVLGCHSAQAFGSFALPEKIIWGFVARARPVEASHHLSLEGLWWGRMPAGSGENHLS